MLPPELMGGPPPDMGQGPPPDMGAMMGPPPGMPPEMAGPPSPGPDMGGMPPEPPPEQAQGAGRASDILKAILGLASEYSAQENSEQNILLIEQLRTLCQKILAEEEKEGHDLMQGKVTPKAILTHG